MASITLWAGLTPVNSYPAGSDDDHGRLRWIPDTTETDP